MCQHTTPCSKCPWLKQSLPGWLGSSTPVEFLQQSESGIRMPCHSQIDYDTDDWEDVINETPQCAGRSIHMANRAKHILTILKLVPDRERVFSNPQDFVDHHSRGVGPKIMIIGSNVMELS